MQAPPAVYAEPVSSTRKSFSFTNLYASHEIDSVDLFTQPVEIDYSVILSGQIDKFRHLEYNWDGYGAVPPSGLAINNAKLFISLLPENFTKRLSKDDIIPTPYGTIAIEWFGGEDSLTAEVGDSKIGLVSDIENSPEILIDGKLFDGQKLPDEVVKGLFKLF